MNIPDQPIAMSPQIHTHTELRQQIHHDLRIQHPEWVEPNGESPTCDSYEARAERKRTGQALHQAKNELELNVLERTAELRKANEDLVAEIAQREQAEEDLRHAQAELAHVIRVATVGGTTASIAHEVNQPLSAVVVNGGACLRWLARDPPNLDEARDAARCIVRDGKRAGDVIARIRALATKTATPKQRMNMNEAIQEVVALARSELRRNNVTLRMELEDDLSPVLGDRVQLQQVVLNLVMNGVEAMSTVGERPRELVIRTQKDEADQVRVAVQDSGMGLDPQSRERIFDAFYTTKDEGMGVGLSISRSIVQNHGGRLWAVANDGPGTTFQFTVPKYRETQNAYRTNVLLC